MAGDGRQLTNRTQHWIRYLTRKRCCWGVEVHRTKFWQPSQKMSTIIACYHLHNFYLQCTGQMI